MREKSKKGQSDGRQKNESTMTENCQTSDLWGISET